MVILLILIKKIINVYRETILNFIKTWGYLVVIKRMPTRLEYTHAPFTNGRFSRGALDIFDNDK